MIYRRLLVGPGQAQYSIVIGGIKLPIVNASKQVEMKDVYTDQLHEALLAKQGLAFLKCWGSKFEGKKTRVVNSENGMTNPEGIADVSVSNLSKSCSSNTAEPKETCYNLVTLDGARFNGQILLDILVFI